MKARLVPGKAEEHLPERRSSVRGNEGWITIGGGGFVRNAGWDGFGGCVLFVLLSRMGTLSAEEIFVSPSDLEALKATFLKQIELGGLVEPWTPRRNS